MNSMTVILIIFMINGILNKCENKRNSYTGNSKLYEYQFVIITLIVKLLTSVCITHFYSQYYIHYIFHFYYHIMIKINYKGTGNNCIWTRSFLWNIFKWFMGNGVIRYQSVNLKKFWFKKGLKIWVFMHDMILIWMI